MLTAQEAHAAVAAFELDAQTRLLALGCSLREVADEWDRYRREIDLYVMAHARQQLATQLLSDELILSLN